MPTVKGQRVTSCSKQFFNHLWQMFKKCDLSSFIIVITLQSRYCSPNSHRFYTGRLSLLTMLNCRGQPCIIVLLKWLIFLNKERDIAEKQFFVVSHQICIFVVRMWTLYYFVACSSYSVGDKIVLNLNVQIARCLQVFVLKWIFWEFNIIYMFSTNTEIFCNINEKQRALIFLMIILHKLKALMHAILNLLLNLLHRQLSLSCSHVWQLSYLFTQI